MKPPKPVLSKGMLATLFLSPMIPIWVPRRRFPQSLDKTMETDFQELPKAASFITKECAICRKTNADYEHTCGVAFHKACIEQYFDAISMVEGAERICPHCYAPVPFDLEPDKNKAIEVSPIPEELYNQYLEVSDEFSLALIDGRIRDISVFLTSPSGEEYYVNVDLGYYPRKPSFSFPDDLLHNLNDVEELLEMLSTWDSEFPPRLMEILLDIQSAIEPKKEEPEEIESEIEDPEEKVEEGGEQKDQSESGDLPPEVEVSDTQTEDRSQKTEPTQFQDVSSPEAKEGEVVEVFPEGDFVEVTPETFKLEEDVQEVEEVLPANFFEFEPLPEFQVVEFQPSEEVFENEEAISQYLDLNNNFSVELVGDEIYHVVVYLSCLDAGIYNIYPITINFKDYPKKPSVVFTDDLLIRIRGLDEVLGKLKDWDSLNPHALVDLLQTIEMRLIEDSWLESEFEVIRREYRMRKLGHKRILVTLSTYGPRYFDIELDLRDYPDLPKIILPRQLQSIDINELESIKRWPDKPQKRIMDVLRGFSQIINNLFRLEFEESLLEMVSDELEIKDGVYKVVIRQSESEGETISDEEMEEESIILNIKLPKTYPYLHPEITIDTDDEELKDRIQDQLLEILKTWAPNIYLADAVNRISLSLWNRSLFKCRICGQRTCPECNLPLLTEPVKDTKDLCEVPCIQCKRPYHVHCLERSIEEGISECGYCRFDLGTFLGKNIFRIIE